MLYIIRTGANILDKGIIFSIIYFNKLKHFLKINIFILITYILWIINKLTNNRYFYYDKIFIQKLSFKYIILKINDPVELFFVVRAQQFHSDPTSISLACERDVLKIVLDVLRKGNIVIDVGAHIGAYTVRSAKIIGDKGKVIAIEPHPDNLKYLESNIRINNLNNVYVEKVALLSSRKKIRLYYDEESTDGSSIMFKQNKGIEVEGTTLDEITRKYNLKKIDLIKIDAEGAELEVLKGANETLKITERLIIEVRPENEDKVLNILKENNFRTINLGLHYWNLVYYFYCYRNDL